MHFACSVVRSGKTFLRKLLSVARKRHHYIQLNQSFRSDLRWWDLFLAPLNRRPLARPIIPASQRITFASDASGSIGCGALWTPHWLQLLWRETGNNQIDVDSITFKELLPTVLACAIWGHMWTNQSVVVLCDNQGAVAGTNCIA